MKLEIAENIANKYLKEIRLITESAEIAGSIRRRISEVHNIEFVVIPKTILEPDGFFSKKPVPVPAFIEFINGFEKVRGDAYGRYTRRKLPEGIEADIFIASPNNWGHILAIRTGPKMFSQNIMGRLKRFGYKSVDGFVYSHKGMVPIKEEKQIFRMIRLEYIPPAYRV